MRIVVVGTSRQHTTKMRLLGVNQAAAVHTRDWMLIGFLRTITQVTIERISAVALLPKMLGVFYDNPRSCLYRNVIVLRQTQHLNRLIFWE